MENTGVSPPYYSAPSIRVPESLHYDYADYAATAPLHSLSFRGFSERSPSHHDDQAYHRYFSPYGAQTTGPVPSTSAHAYLYEHAGMPIAGPSSSQGQPPSSSQLGGNVFRGNCFSGPQEVWQWGSETPYSEQGAVHVPAPRGDGGSAYNKEPEENAPFVRTPTAQLPTPAAMAILLNTTSRHSTSEGHPPPPQYTPLEDSNPDEGDSYQAAPDAATGSSPGDSDSVSRSAPEPPVREKRHGCWMCHKSFDRPSTLRKHLLVHTGEKAFKCDTCGRRFGVASNLNRHVRKCILKPVNMIARGDSDSPPSTTSASATRRGRATTSAESNEQQQSGKQTKPKRHRRAPSPSNWIPPSLLGFNLKPEDFKKSVPVPLPPVVPSKTEERNSWDENVDASPYHPRGWKHKLPGPGLGMGLGLARDLRNIDLAGNGGIMLGRVSVF